MSGLILDAESEAGAGQGSAADPGAAGDRAAAHRGSGEVCGAGLARARRNRAGCNKTCCSDAGERARSERARRAEQERRSVLERVQKKGRLEQKPEPERRVQLQWLGSGSLASMREVGGMFGAVEEWQGMEEDVSDVEERHASGCKGSRRMEGAESYVSCFPMLPPITGKKRLWRE